MFNIAFISKHLMQPSPPQFEINFMKQYSD